MIGTFNLILIALYFLIVLYIGINAAKREDDEGFLLANRDVEPLVLTATFVASVVGGNMIVTTMAFVYQYGVSVIWTAIGLFLGFIALAFFAPRIKRIADKYKFYTLPDFIYKKYGKGASIPTALIIFLAYMGFMIIQFIAGGIILSAITGWPYSVSVLLMGIVVIIYISAAGFRAVIRTDLFQYFILLLLVILSVSLLGQAGTINPENLRLFAAGPVNILAFLFYGFILILIGAELWPRVYAGKNIKTVKQSLVYAGIITTVLLTIIIIMGLLIQSRFPDIIPETALAVGFSQLLPNYLLGIGLIVLFAAIMSSLDTFLFVLSTSFSKDFLGKFERLSHHKFARSTRLFSIILGGIGIFLALVLTSIVSVISAIAGVYFALFPAIAFSLKYHLKKGAVVLSIVGGFFSSTIAFVFMGVTVEAAIVSLPASLILLGIGQLVFRRNQNS